MQHKGRYHYVEMRDRSTGKLVARVGAHPDQGPQFSNLAQFTGWCKLAAELGPERLQIGGMSSPTSYETTPTGAYGSLTKTPWPTSTKAMPSGRRPTSQIYKGFAPIHLPASHLSPPTPARARRVNEMANNFDQVQFRLLVPGVDREPDGVHIVIEGPEDAIRSLWGLRMHSEEDPWGDGDRSLGNLGFILTEKI